MRAIVKDWEIIADNLSKAGWSWGCVSALDCEGRTIWIVGAHRDDGKRYVVRADEILTAFLELEAHLIRPILERTLKNVRRSPTFSIDTVLEFSARLHSR
jgi:hypothetical protein